MSTHSPSSPDKRDHTKTEKRGMTNAELMEKGGFSANIITRLKRNNYIALENIERICCALDCGVDDILEFIPNEKEKENHG